MLLIEKIMVLYMNRKIISFLLMLVFVIPGSQMAVGDVEKNVISFKLSITTENGLYTNMIHAIQFDQESLTVYFAYGKSFESANGDVYRNGFGRGCGFGSYNLMSGEIKNYNLSNTRTMGDGLPNNYISAMCLHPQSNQLFLAVLDDNNANLNVTIFQTESETFRNYNNSNLIGELTIVAVNGVHDIIYDSKRNDIFLFSMWCDRIDLDKKTVYNHYDLYGRALDDSENDTIILHQLVYDNEDIYGRIVDYDLNLCIFHNYSYPIANYPFKTIWGRFSYLDKLTRHLYFTWTLTNDSGEEVTLLKKFNIDDGNISTIYKFTGKYELIGIDEKKQYLFLNDRNGINSDYQSTIIFNLINRTICRELSFPEYDGKPSFSYNIIPYNDMLFIASFNGLFFYPVFQNQEINAFLNVPNVHIKNDENETILLNISKSESGEKPLSINVGHHDLFTLSYPNEIFLLTFGSLKTIPITIRPSQTLYKKHEGLYPINIDIIDENLKQVEKRIILWIVIKLPFPLEIFYEDDIDFIGDYGFFLLELTTVYGNGTYEIMVNDSCDDIFSLMIESTFEMKNNEKRILNISIFYEGSDINPPILKLDIISSTDAGQIKNIVAFCHRYFFPLIDKIPDSIVFVEQDNIINVNVSNHDVGECEITYTSNLLKIEYSNQTSDLNIHPNEGDEGIYFVNVTATNRRGLSSTIGFNLTVNDNNPPSMIKNLRCFYGYSFINVTWDSSEDHDITGRELFINGKIILIDNSTTFINITDLEPNTMYSIKVRNFDEVPNYSPNATLINITTLSDINEDDLDGDGFNNSDDAFPNDPTQWIDTDNDGFGDNKSGNDPDIFPYDDTQSIDTDGDGFGDNLTGNNPDIFPVDPDEWNDTDWDGIGDNSDMFPLDPNEWYDSDDDGVGDNTDAFPTDPSASIDTDGDGSPDSWNPGMGPEDSTSDPPLELDPYPNDPDNIPPDDDGNETPANGKSRAWIWASGIAVIVVAIVAVMLFQKKKEPPEEVDDHGWVEAKPNEERP